MNARETVDAHHGVGTRSDAELDPEPGRSRLDRSGGGRLLVTGFLLVTLASILVSVMPSSAIRDGLLPVARPFLLATGLDQRWGVFAPNPRRETSDVVARIDRTDGTVVIRPITRDPGLSEYWNYRWRKYGEQLWLSRDTGRERVAYARWVARQDRAAGGRPVLVTLLRHTRESLPPGPGPDHGPWQDVPFFALPVGTP